MDSYTYVRPRETGTEVGRGDAHRLAEVAEERSRLAEFDRLVKTLACGAHEPLGVFVDAADGVRLVEVRVEAYDPRVGKHVRHASDKWRQIAPSLYRETSAWLRCSQFRAAR